MYVRVCNVCVRVCHVCVPTLCVFVCINMLRAVRRECKFTHTRTAELQLEYFTQRTLIKVCVCVYMMCVHTL